jgi:hypothetical protein
MHSSGASRREIANFVFEIGSLKIESVAAAQAQALALDEA